MDFLNFLFIGLVNGSIFALVSMGIALLFGTVRIINVAHGELFVIGAYIAITLTNATENIGFFQAHPFLGPMLSLILSTGVAFLLGFGLDRVLFFRIREKGENIEETILVLTLGLSLLIQNVLLLLFGAEPKQSASFTEGVISVVDVRISKTRIIVAGIAILLIIVLFLILVRTKLGMTIRAVSQNPEAARALGVPADRMYAFTMGTSTALAASAGSLVAAIFWITPTSGSPLAIKGFIIVILGGLGSITGALVGSYIIGLAESMSIIFLPSQFKELIGILIMIGILIFRPFGLFGKEE
ncbi:MAG: branched-chain amino acid ABC transporter permease [Candidatus Heimdallarchaeota archaeon]